MNQRIRLDNGYLEISRDAPIHMLLHFYQISKFLFDEILESFGIAPVPSSTAVLYLDGKHLCIETARPWHFVWIIQVLCDCGEYLLERHVRSISEGNAANKLPIHLLLCVDRESPEYLETIWRLLLAHPETLFN